MNTGTPTTYDLKYGLLSIACAWQRCCFFFELLVADLIKSPVDDFLIVDFLLGNMEPRNFRSVEAFGKLPISLDPIYEANKIRLRSGRIQSKKSTVNWNIIFTYPLRSGLYGSLNNN